MSLNHFEQALFDYWEDQADERRHWQAKVTGITHGAAQPIEAARALERELWEYIVERSQHVGRLRQLSSGGLQRVSLLNLSEHLIRLWRPPPKSKKSANPLP